MKTRALASFLLLTSMAIAAGAKDQRSFYRPFGSWASGKTVTYTVKPDETLFDIAGRLLGDPYQAQEIARRNNIRDPLHLEAGTKIEVPMPRLAIRYTIQKLVAGESAGGGNPSYDVEPVNANPRLAAGDRFQLWLSANCDGYLYIFNRDAQGQVNRIFPSGNRKTARVRRFSEYLVPRDGWFQMDKARGDEELWVLVSLEPLSKLEGTMIASGAVESYFDGKDGVEAKGIVLDEGGDGDGSTVVEGPIEGGVVLAYKIRIERK
jgi:hypothetical protein